MTIKEILERATEEIQAFYDASDRRAHLAERTGLLFDTYVEPWDLPLVPDVFFDPVLRKVFLSSVDFAYLAVVKQFTEKEKPLPPWPSITKVDGGKQ